MREKYPYKRRIQVAVSILSELSKKGGELTRPQVVEILRRTYEKQGLQPIRGKALPQDIYDKELATVYVVGKHGLNLHEEYPELFEKVFYLEGSYEKAVESILNGDYQAARRILKEVSSSGVIDSNTVARMLRIPLTKLVLGFAREDEFANILRKTIEAFPEEEATVLKYVKFYVAFKLAEMIFRGEVKSREYKEALKKALAIRMGFPRATPSDDYVKAIAESVFELSDQVLKDILKKPGETASTTNMEKSG